MYQRSKVLRALHKAGLHKSRRQKVRRFLSFLSKSKRISWEDAAKEFRDKYGEIIDDIIPPILATEDPLIIANLFRHADLKKKKELDHLKRFVQKANSFSNEVTFKFLVEHYYRELEDVFLKKERLPRSIHAAISFKKRELELAKKTKKEKSKKSSSHKTLSTGSTKGKRK